MKILLKNTIDTLNVSDKVSLLAKNVLNSRSTSRKILNDFLPIIGFGTLSLIFFNFIINPNEIVTGFEFLSAAAIFSFIPLYFYFFIKYLNNKIANKFNDKNKIFVKLYKSILQTNDCIINSFNNERIKKEINHTIKNLTDSEKAYILATDLSLNLTYLDLDSVIYYLNNSENKNEIKNNFDFFVKLLENLKTQHNISSKKSLLIEKIKTKMFKIKTEQIEIKKTIKTKPKTIIIKDI